MVQPSLVSLNCLARIIMKERGHRRWDSTRSKGAGDKSLTAMESSCTLLDTRFPLHYATTVWKNCLGCCNVACHAPSLCAASTNIAAKGPASPFSRSNMQLCPLSKDSGKPRLLLSMCLCIPHHRVLTQKCSKQFHVGFFFCSILKQPSCISFFASL